MTFGGSRRARRFLVDDCDVEVRSQNLKAMLSKGQIFPVVNLSQGGIQFICFHPLKVGQNLRLSINVGGQFGFIRSAAVVRWLEQIPGEQARRVGASFVKMPKGEQVKLGKMDTDYWPRQQEIKETGLKRLKLPPSVARKLSVMIGRWQGPTDHEMLMLVREGMTDAPMGNIGNLTEAHVDKGRWIDTARGLVFRNPEASFGRHKAEGRARPRDADAAEEPEPSDETPTPEPEPPPPPPPEAVHVQEPSTEVDAEPAKPNMEPIPLFLLGQQHSLPVDEEGRPNGACASMLALPGFGPGHFACRLVDNTMHSPHGRSFRLGDIVVFSMNRTAESEANAFVTVPGGPVFRQVFYEPGDVVRLRALNSNHGEVRLERSVVSALWPSVAHIGWL